PSRAMIRNTSSSSVGRRMLRITSDSTLRFVNHLPSPPVPHYAELDGRFGWNPTPQIELSIIGRNLLDKQHPEFGPPGPFREEAQRNVYGNIYIQSSGHLYYKMLIENG